MISTIALGDIYQWEDGDGDGSLWLSDSVVSPYADMSGQLLWWAELNGANLHHANLQEANLMYAQLAYANFGSSNLYFINLHGADLTDANLSFTILSGADLSSSSVANANLLMADLTNADLSDMAGWEDAFWLAARYNDNTVLPDGMDPDLLGMIEVPAPATMFFLVAACIGSCKRRNSTTL
jgi:hypothetical protein